MLRILIEALGPVLHGQRLGFRLRVKPSWSGRVYGTYTLGGRHLCLALVFVGSVLGLFARLLELNLAAVSPASEAAALRRTAAHGHALREVTLPARVRELEGRSQASQVLGHQLAKMLGVRLDGDVALGLGTLEEASPAPAPFRSDAERLERLADEVERLERQYGRLGQVLAVQETEMRFLPSIVPVFQADFVPTSTFGRRLSPFTGQWELHRGQDLAADMFSKIVATADGTVVHVERDARRSAMGRYLVIDHGGRYQTYYGHCERIFVEVGDAVRRHQIVAEVGNTGRSTGPHVHYEVRSSGEPRDPRHFMVFDPHFSSEEQLRFD